MTSAAGVGVANYIEEFINANSDKPFVANLRKYADLDKWGRLKVISSMLTHIFIDAETTGRDNVAEQRDLIGILMDYVYYDNDTFLDWLEEQIGGTNA